jgi:hypothetical protein
MSCKQTCGKWDVTAFQQDVGICRLCREGEENKSKKADNHFDGATNKNKSFACLCFFGWDVGILLPTFLRHFCNWSVYNTLENIYFWQNDKLFGHICPIQKHSFEQILVFAEVLMSLSTSTPNIWLRVIENLSQNTHYKSSIVVLFTMFTIH